MAKAFKDPTQVIAPVMPFPIDSPALKVEVLSTNKNEQQTHASPRRKRTPANPITTTWRNQVTRTMDKAAKLAAGIAAPCR